MTQATPVIFAGGKPHSLHRISLRPAGATGNDTPYDEKWLQELIQACPTLLPVPEIEVGFGELIPVGQEVACGHGSIDNLFVTAEGNIAIVETKLWRNPEMRRKVVAQALDYATALSRMKYEEFEAAALGALKPAEQPTPATLYNLARSKPNAVVEAVFIENICRNLRLGRMLVIVAGEGFKAETELLAEFVQAHVGAHFYFALVEISLFKMEEGAILAVPQAVAKTILIERGIVQIIDGNVSVKPSPADKNLAGKSTTMTQELFMEALAKRGPALPEALSNFLDRIKDLGVEPDWRANLNLKWQGPGGPVNLGFIAKEGGVYTEATNSRVGVALAAPYQRELAEIAGGRALEKTPGQGPHLMAADGKISVKIEELLPSKANAWAEAMRRFIDRIREDDARQV